MRVNVLAYADDIVLLANAYSTMNELYKIFALSIEKLKLKINKDKTKCMIVGKHLGVGDDNTIKLGNDTLEIVKSYEYLGHSVSYNLKDDKDVEKRLNKFYGSFNGILRNFSLVDIRTFLFLFNAYCKPDYGLCLWNGRYTLNSSIFKAFELAYSKAFKRMTKSSLFASNHDVAEKCNQLLLKHHLALTQARYLKRLERSRSAIINLNLPILKQGYFYTYITKQFVERYSVDISSLSLDIVFARIQWVQRHEERRGPAVLPT